MQVSDEGLQLTKDSESLKLRAYRDTGGVLTIGWGHTGGVKENQVIDEATATTLLRHDLDYAVGVVNSHCLPCTQGQFDALVDFVFNVGLSQFLSSHLFAYHAAREYEKAAAEFPKWKYDNGKVQPGLVTRRAREMNLYTRQEPEVTHPHTDEQVHSAPSSDDPVRPGLPTTGSQSSPALPEPASGVGQESGNKPSGFLPRVAESFRRLIAGLGGSKD